ncbi:LysE/ArgO family amino acid transporter [Chitinimonas sp. BJB300]|uniref:LysE/ArgO family amino acid transporter n=1 Tax=Chitinimonas sp. BJB300 TaxID=1559339 RepID=UPI000C0D8687|nr:LysE/ArgO family amino acid transporter [Chitinimonas sp. BJB300]PHV10929.1 amino acid transporter [Chitinimonas sp. BJB300]TSJ89939.1 amino acid transporter [Chitinimonas sp. BJB300]
MLISSAFLKGLGVSAGLIMAIGAQNAHVLRMGLKRQHVVLTVIACVLIDACLISLGVAGMGAVVQNSPNLMIVARWGGTAFLLWYGLRSWRAAFSSNTLETDSKAQTLTTREALLTVLALSLLNPHVYLDTVVLIGSIGGRHPTSEQTKFIAGAISASLLWFCALGFGAHLLSPWFARPIAWRGIDALTGTTMLGLAALVALG